MTSITIANKTIPNTSKTIELRKISHSASLSEETHAYTAQVWVDGHHICDVSNHGHGGCDMQHPAKGFTRENIAALNDYIKQNAPKRSLEASPGNTFEMEETLETICGELVNQHLTAKDLTRLLKRTVAFVRADAKGVMTYKGKMSDVDKTKMIVVTAQKYPGVHILNAMPFADALALYRQHG